MTTYNNRQEFEMGHWPELREAFNKTVQTVWATRELSEEFKQLIFTMASFASGCQHCQSHGAFHLQSMGVETERIRAIWEYETSDLFSAAERAALNLVRAAAQIPNATTAEHFEELRKHYSNTQIIEILAVNSAAAWLNRWNDTIATVTDQESVDWALENLSDVGWSRGKHVGEENEQRKAHPLNMGWILKQESTES
ncbi:MAG: carboxymuconolactone decarboxylase family protein [Chloroflexota bacterium]